MEIVKDKTILRKKLIPKPLSNQQIKKLSEILIRELKRHKGLGLAANQIGLESRICLVNVKKPLILVNPKITQESKEKIIFEEQCLSLDETINVIRSKNITVECDNLGVIEFSPDYTFGTEDLGLLECVCVQHEIDHLNGILITDKI